LLSYNITDAFSGAENMKHRLRTFLLAATVFALPAMANAEIAVIASIKPVHSLVASVMQGVGEPALIVEGGASPHTYSLKPSQASALQDADVVFWVGHELEAFLEKPLETLGSKATAMALLDADGVTRLPFREGGPFEAHAHEGEEGHDDHAEKSADGHAHDHDHDKETAEKKADGHAHDDHAKEEAGHDHAHEGFDAHAWLDPRNAAAFADVIAATLSQKDPGNAATYAANADALKKKLAALESEIATTLEPVKGKGFIVFHDAYQYFENRFGIAASGSITVTPEVMPGAERLGEIQAKVKELGATCVFSEPQFEPKLVSVVIEGTNARTGVLDAEGGTEPAGTDQYFFLLRNIAKSLRDCLSPAS
jgi:zinc transport system substrate-binding protein